VPELGVATHGDRQHFLVLIEELVLAQDSMGGAVGNGDGAVARRLIAGEDAEERGLAGAVGADKPVPVARQELKGDIGK
jgi:hypothetical protein